MQTKRKFVCDPVSIAALLLIDYRKDTELVGCMIKKSASMKGQVPRTCECELNGKCRCFKLCKHLDQRSRLELVEDLVGEVASNA